MQNCRANSSLCTTKEEQIADMVYANHTRKRVIYICNKELNDIRNRETRLIKNTGELEMIDKQRSVHNEQKFWVWVNKAEAHFGLGEFDEYKKAFEEAKKIEHKPWMIESFEEQVAKLRILLEKNGYLLNPPWKEITGTV